MKFLRALRPAKEPILTAPAIPATDGHDLEVFRSFDRELQTRLRSLELEADVLGRRRHRTAGAGEMD